MTTLEKLIKKILELDENKRVELLEHLNKSEKQENIKRKADRFKGKIWMSDDFNDTMVLVDEKELLKQEEAV